MILIAAPFFGPGGWQFDGVPSGECLGSALPPGLRISVWHGDADGVVPQEHARLYARAIPQAQLHLLSDRDHQLNNDLREIAADIRVLAQQDAG